MAETLTEFSEGLAEAVARAAQSVVRVEDGSRLTASGVVWNAEGVIVATSHGVETDEDISIVTAEGTSYPALLVGRDMDTDIAVLRVTGATLTALETTDRVRAGNIALAVARPGDWGLHATIGIVSARRETETSGHAEYLLHTDANLYPGFSGGALVNPEGQFTGLLNRAFGRGFGVALGTPLVARVVETLLKHGRVPRGYLGVRTQLVPIPANLKATLSLEQEHGLLVIHADTGSPAEKGGLYLGDVLLKINDTAVEDVSDLRRHLQAGETVTITVLRGGALNQIAVTVGAKAE